MTAIQMLNSNACAALGYTGSPIAGTSYTDTYIGEVGVRALVQQRANYPIVCGASPREARRRNRQLSDAAMKDAKRILGIGLVAIIMGLLTGPVGAIVAILSGVISWMVENELNDDFKSMFACAAMEVGA